MKIICSLEFSSNVLIQTIVKGGIQYYYYFAVGFVSLKKFYKSCKNVKLSSFSDVSISIVIQSVSSQTTRSNLFLETVLHAQDFCTFVVSVSFLRPQIMLTLLRV